MELGAASYFFREKHQKSIFGFSVSSQINSVEFRHLNSYKTVSQRDCAVSLKVCNLGYLWPPLDTLLKAAPLFSA